MLGAIIYLQDVPYDLTGKVLGINEACKQNISITNNNMEIKGYEFGTYALPRIMDATGRRYFISNVMVTLNTNSPWNPIW